MRPQGDGGVVAVADLLAGGIPVRVVGALHGEPGLVVVAAMSSTMVRMSVSGRPRQFMEMKLNRRCSILFHLDVPGG